jgi:hypothetical protein
LRGGRGGGYVEEGRWVVVKRVPEGKGSVVRCGGLGDDGQGVEMIEGRRRCGARGYGGEEGAPGDVFLF